jgi:hypothetical protein
LPGAWIIWSTTKSETLKNNKIPKMSAVLYNVREV